MPWRRSPPEFSGGSRQAVEMTVCGKHGKTMKPFSHPSHSPTATTTTRMNSILQTRPLRDTHSEGKVKGTRRLIDLRNLFRLWSWNSGGSSNEEGENVQVTECGDVNEYALPSAF